MASEEGEGRIAPLYKTEAEIAALVGVGVKKWRAVARVLEREGLPKVNPMFGRRYWPAVRRWLDAMEGMGPDGRPPPVVDQRSKEDWSTYRGRRKS